MGTDVDTVSKWERGINLPNPFFREKLIALFGKNAAELGLLGQQSYNGNPPKDIFATDNKSTSVVSESNSALDTPPDIQIQSAPGIITIHQHLTGSTATPFPSTTIHIYTPGSIGFTQPYNMEGIPARVDTQTANTAYSHYRDNAQTITISEPGNITVNRRDFFRQTGHAAITGAAILATHDIPSDELLSRFIRAVKKPSTIDTSTLSYLERHTKTYWQDRHGAILPSIDLFSYATEHFQRIVSLLEGSYLPSVRTRLCTIASWSALLVGELLIDMGYYSKARMYHQAALVAAQEADNTALQAVAWGRTSLGWIYSKNMSEALACIQQGRLLAKGNASITIRAWLAAIEAEIQANLANSDACLKALDDAEKFEDRDSSPEDSYMILFDRTLLNGYQGVCFRRLYRPGDAKTSIFLENAQEILRSALASLDPIMKQRRPTFLTDLADAYLRQGEIEEACRQANHALIAASEIKLQKVIKRLHDLRQELEPWKDTSHVKEFDKNLLSLRQG